MPRTVGVGVFVVKADKILIGKRGPACSRGKGCLALPGGMLDPGETVEACAVREVREEARVNVFVLDVIGRETGHASIDMRVGGLLAVTDHLDLPEGHVGRVEHLTMWMLAHWMGGIAHRQEPDKCEWWRWMTLEQLCEVAGAWDRESEQYHWTPMPLWLDVLAPTFGAEKCAKLLAEWS